VVRHLVRPRRRDQRRQLLKERQSLEDNPRGAIRPGVS